jgi:hypothetical protein
MVVKTSLKVHGLGDSSHAVQMFDLWRRRGHVFLIDAGPYEWLWSACGYKTMKPTDCPPAKVHPWPEPRPATGPEPWNGNKVGLNLTWPDGPLPRIGTIQDLWPEVLGVRFDLTEKVPAEARERVDRLHEGLPRPVVACHFHGHTSPEKKDFPVSLEREILAKLRETCSPVVIGDLGLSIPELYELIRRADVFLGIDSGPYHLARLTNTPRVGCWWGIPPWHASLPFPTDVNLYGGVNVYHPDGFNIVEGEITAARIVDTVCRAVNPPPSSSATPPPP